MRKMLTLFLFAFAFSACDNLSSKDQALVAAIADENPANENVNSDQGGLDAESPESAPPASNDASSIKFTPGESFYWQLSGTVKNNHNVKVYDIDLENNQSNEIISALQNKGVKVICYFSAGTYEDWRSDARDFPSEALGSPLDEWPGERWLDVRNQGVRRVLMKRLDLAKAAGCDAVEPDNLDGYQNSNGLGLTAKDQIDFLHWLAAEAHNRGLSIGLKNALDIITTGKLYDHFDWALNEQCYEYGECSILKEFVVRNKAVFIAEYQSFSANSCADAKKNGFSLAYFNLALNGGRFETCP